MDQIKITELLAVEDGNEVVIAKFFFMLFPNKFLYEVKTMLFYFVNDYGLYINDTANIELMAAFNAAFHYKLKILLKRYEKTKEKKQHINRMSRNLERIMNSSYNFFFAKNNRNINGVGRCLAPA